MAGWTCEALLNCDAVTLLLDLLMDSEAHCREAAKAIGSMAAAHDAVQVRWRISFGGEVCFRIGVA